MKLFLLLGILLFSFGANAVQFGFAISKTDGDGKADESGNPAIDNFDVATTGANFTMNLCESCGSFQYRLHAGISEGEIKYSGSSDDIKSLSVTNSFGFKIVDNENLNFWVGPSVFASSWSIDGDFTDDEDAIVWGWGPTIGIDFKLQEGSIIALELSARNLKADVDTDAFEDYDIDDFEFQVSFLF